MLGKTGQLILEDYAMEFWCRHHNQTTPRKDGRGEYRRCLDCGVRIPWSWPGERKVRTRRRSPLFDWVEERLQWAARLARLVASPQPERDRVRAVL
jgi:hypothetical protein